MPEHSPVIDYPQKKFPHDLTERYRHGIGLLKDRCDLIFFIEDDDYYPVNYLETMTFEWEKAGRPDLFGIGETFFYHVGLQYVWYRKHPKDGPCAFQLCLRSDAVERIDWSLVSDLFIDAPLWRQLKGVAKVFGKPLALGIKHGIGQTGAGGHNKWFYEDRIRKIGSDQLADEWAMKDDGSWLRKMIGLEDANWYEENFAA